MRSVLIVSDEYSFLLSSYSWLRQDARVGRIEATTNEAEALARAESYRPDVVVFDATPSGGFGLATVRRLRESNPGVDIVVTMGEQCPATLAGSAMASGAVGVLTHDRFSADACFKLTSDPASASPRHSALEAHPDQPLG
jgi:DNA-binding NarL/FixJ family response regulator